MPLAYVNVPDGPGRGRGCRANVRATCVLRGRSGLAAAAHARGSNHRYRSSRPRRRAKCPMRVSAGYGPRALWHRGRADDTLRVPRHAGAHDGTARSVRIIQSRARMAGRDSRRLRQALRRGFASNNAQRTVWNRWHPRDSRGIPAGRPHALLGGPQLGAYLRLQDRTAARADRHGHARIGAAHRLRKSPPGWPSGKSSASSAGVISTPGVACLVRKEKFSAGVVISASHNPYHDNGVKLFAGSGMKFPDEIEEQTRDGNPAPPQRPAAGAPQPILSTGPPARRGLSGISARLRASGSELFPG